MEKPIEKLTIDDALNALKVIKEFCTINEGSCMNCPFRTKYNDECTLESKIPNSWELNESVVGVKIYTPRLIL